MDTSRQKQNLAYKARGYLASLFVSLIILAFSIAGFCTVENKHWFILISVLALSGLVTLTYGIFYLTLPSVLIKYDDSGIYMYRSRKREIFIKYEDITDILAYNRSYRGSAHTHGKLHIATPDGEYDSFTVENVTTAVQTVYKLKKEHGFPDLRADKRLSPINEYMKRYKPAAVTGKVMFIVCVLTMTVLFSVYFDKWGLTALLGILTGFGGTFIVGMSVKAIYVRILNSVTKKLITADGTVVSCTVITTNHDHIKREVTFIYKTVIDADGVKTVARTKENLQTGKKVSVLFNPDRPRYCVII